MNTASAGVYAQGVSRGARSLGFARDDGEVVASLLRDFGRNAKAHFGRNDEPIFPKFSEICSSFTEDHSPAMEGKTMSISANTALPDVLEVVQEETVVVHVPLYHVVLLDDDAHTYDYVIEMLGHVFGYSIERAYQMACEVDAEGRVIVDTTHLDRAELKRDQIHGFGADWRMPNSKGSMSAVVEPAE